MLDGMQQVLLDRQPEEVGNLDADRFIAAIKMPIRVID
jgi:hypothetical protein